MGKVSLYKAINMGLLVSFLIQAFTAVIMVLRIRLPHPQAVFEVHEYNGILMVVLAVWHIVLNRRWIETNFFKKR
jgi:succinate dehydrogenase hydrophobic anchor subunit